MYYLLFVHLFILFTSILNLINKYCKKYPLHIILNWSLYIFSLYVVPMILAPWTIMDHSNPPLSIWMGNTQTTQKGERWELPIYVDRGGLGGPLKFMGIRTWELCIHDNKKWWHLPTKSGPCWKIKFWRFHHFQKCKFSNDMSYARLADSFVSIKKNVFNIMLLVGFFYWFVAPLCYHNLPLVQYFWVKVT